jgi:zinc protease
MTQPTSDHVAMALYIDTGVTEESRAEAGAADLVARLAFARSKDLGPFNGGAKTDSFETTYSLDLPDANNAQLVAGLAWLRSVADGVNMTPAAVEASRKALTDDQAHGDQTGDAMEAAASRLFTPQLQRQGIPTATAQAAQAFYEHWYRPDNAILVVVGPLPNAALRVEAERAFGSWLKPSAALVHSRIDPPDLTLPLQASAYSASSLLAAVQVCRMGAAAKPQVESVSVWRRRLADEAWAFVLERRLQRVGEGPQPILAAAKAALDTDPHLEWDQACIHVASLNQDWQGDLTLVEHEARRLELYGITDEEWDRFQAAQKAQLEANIAGAQRMSPADLLDIILANLVTGDTLDTAEEDQRIHALALMELSKSAVDSAFRSHWSQAGQPLIFVTAADPATADQVKAVWLKAQADPLSPPPVHTPEAPSAPTDDPRGAVVAQAARGSDSDSRRAVPVHRPG